MPAWLTRLNHYLPIRYGVWLLCALAALLSAYLWWRAGANLGLRLLPPKKAD